MKEYSKLLFCVSYMHAPLFVQLRQSEERNLLITGQYTLREEHSTSLCIPLPVCMLPAHLAFPRSTVQCIRCSKCTLHSRHSIHHFGYKGKLQNDNVARWTEVYVGHRRE